MLLQLVPELFVSKGFYFIYLLISREHNRMYNFKLQTFFFFRRVGKGSIIISSLTVIWYEWLDETWAVLRALIFIEFGF